MRTYTEWGVMREGSVERIDPAAANEAYMSAEQLAHRYAEARPGTVVSRVHHTIRTDWTADETAWVEGCFSILERVLEERVSQVARYGHNDDLEDGTGPDARWLAGTGFNLEHFTATEIEDAFREEYEQHKRNHGGLPTWMHLVREEVAESFQESDPGRLAEELTQVAALCAKWMEALARR